MKLLTKAIALKFPRLYATEKTPDEQKMTVAKFFNPTGSGTWYAFEADALVDAENDKWMPLRDAAAHGVPYSDVRFFGYVAGLGENELGYFLLSELQGVKLRFGLGIERDLYYRPESLATIMARGC